VIMRLAAAALAICALTVGACSGEHEALTRSTEPTAVVLNSPPVPTLLPVSTSVPAPDLLADRPFDVVVPTAYDGSTPMPLVVLLHGLGITGAMQENFFRFQDLADSRGFLMVSPDGTRNADGSPFWNATDACCGSDASVDDSSYLAAVIERVQADYVVDAQRVFLIGYSNGGFMSYRMACDHAEVIAAIVSINAASFLDRAQCTPADPVSVVEIHGTDDETIAYGGGTFAGTQHPSARQTVAQWADYNECQGAPTVTEATLDLDRALAGKETNVLRYDPCAPGGAAELWTIMGGEHVPELSSSFSEEVIDFLLAHPKPLA